MEKQVSEGSLHKWFKGSKSKDGKGGWVNVVTGGTCASDEPGEGTPKCVSSSKRASMTKSERLSAARRKKKADPGQQQKSGAAKPTYVSTDKKKKKMKESYTRTLTPLSEKAQKCWKGYEKKGTKKMFGKTYNNCVKKEEVEMEAEAVSYTDPETGEFKHGGNEHLRGKPKKPIKFTMPKRKVEGDSDGAKYDGDAKPNDVKDPKVFGPPTRGVKYGDPMPGRPKLDPVPQDVIDKLPDSIKPGVPLPDKPSKPSPPIKLGNPPKPNRFPEPKFPPRRTPSPPGYNPPPKQNLPEPLKKPIATIGNAALDRSRKGDGFLGPTVRAGGKRYGIPNPFDKPKRQRMYAGYEPNGETIEEGDKKGKGSGSKDACYHKVKSRYSVWPSAYASGALVKCRKVGAANWGNSSKKEDFSDWKAEFIWEDGDSVKKIEEASSPAWQRKEGKSESGGLNKKGVASYRAANPGSKLKTAVTAKPSTLKRGSKSAKRRKSFCSRMKGMKKKLTSAKTARDPDSRINKALRKWNC